MYLPRLISGEWTVTMALTEPQAGSDLGAIATRAYVEDGSLFIKGRKSLITWGEHDLTENIVHLVLARSPNGGPGVKGLSLYLVPKLRVEGGSNDVKCIGIGEEDRLEIKPNRILGFRRKWRDDGGTPEERKTEVWSRCSFCLTKLV